MSRRNYKSPLWMGYMQEEQLWRFCFELFTFWGTRTYCKNIQSCKNIQLVEWIEHISSVKRLHIHLTCTQNHLKDTPRIRSNLRIDVDVGETCDVKKSVRATRGTLRQLKKLCYKEPIMFCSAQIHITRMFSYENIRQHLMG